MKVVIEVEERRQRWRRSRRRRRKTSANRPSPPSGSTGGGHCPSGRPVDLRLKHQATLNRLVLHSCSRSSACHCDLWPTVPRVLRGSAVPPPLPPSPPHPLLLLLLLYLPLVPSVSFDTVLTLTRAPITPIMQQGHHISAHTHAHTRHGKAEPCVLLMQTELKTHFVAKKVTFYYVCFFTFF